MKVTITDNEAGQRLDRFLRKRCRATPEITLNDIYAWIRKWACRVNTKKVAENYRLVTGDQLTRHEWSTDVSLESKNKPKSEKMRSYDLSHITPLIVYEDDHRIVRNKPAGIVTHPWTNHLTDMSLHDIMQSYLQQTNQKQLSPTFNPAFCFRLDKDTTGIIISAKTYESLQSLNQQIRERQVTKSYLTVVSGHPPKRMEMNQPMAKGYDKKFGVAKMYIERWGKDSLSIAQCRQQYDHPTLWPISLLKVDIHTGRMHQIRVHLSHAWYPLLGDLMYGQPALNRLAQKLKINRQLLHSWQYWFFDPFQNKQVSYTAQIPEDFSLLFADV